MSILLKYLYEIKSVSKRVDSLFMSDAPNTDRFDINIFISLKIFPSR